MRLYVIGANGQVARSLQEVSAQNPELTFGFGARPEVDLMVPTSIFKAIEEFRPDVVINPAAYTNVDKAEQESDQAFAINSKGAGVVAAAAAEWGVPIIHLSTDYVFDGKKKSPYTESDEVCPQSVYGRSKLEGEIAVAKAAPKHIILRTSWVYAPFGSNFVRTMLRLAQGGARLRVVDDQVGCPTFAPDLARAVLAIAQRCSGQDWRADYSGITHIAGPDPRTWCEFAREIFAGAAKRGSGTVLVDPIPSSEYATAANRPANSTLSTKRLETLFNIRMRRLNESLADCLDLLLPSS
jgi:dTDP-4-dehydrorhamnose reductase